MMTLEGDSLLIRLNAYRRAHQKFRSAELRLNMYLSQAQNNGGKLLWTGKVGPYNPEYFDKRHIVNLILLNPNNGHALIGHITAGGEHYDPNGKTPAAGFEPVPQLSGDDPTWIAVDDVQEVERFDVENYTTAPASIYTSPKPLKEVLHMNRGKRVFWIRPNDA